MKQLLKNILVIGSGRLGKRLSANYVSYGMQVTTISSRSNEIVQKELLSELLNQHDTVIWCGRDAGTHTNQENSGENFCNLLGLIKDENWYGYFIYLSSAGDVYGEFRGWAFSEVDEPRPITEYGKIKFLHEKYLLETSRKVQMRVLIPRVTNIFEINELDSGIVGAILRGFAKKELVTIEGGHQTRDFIHMDDVVKSLNDLTMRNVIGVFNVGSGHSFSIDGVQALLEEKFETKLLSTRIELSNRVVESRVSISKLESVLKWKPISIDRKIEQTKI